MFCAVLVAFEVLPQYDLLAQNELGGLVGPAVAIMQRTRVRTSSPDFFGMGTCSIVPRHFLEWVRVKTQNEYS